MYRSLTTGTGPWLKPFMVKCDYGIGLPIYGFLFMFNNTIWPNSAPLPDLRLQTLSDLECDLLRSLNVKWYVTTGCPIYGFLLMFNRNIWLTSAPFQHIRLWNFSYIDFDHVDLFRSLMPKYDGAIGLSTYGFQLMLGGGGELMAPLYLT